MWTDENLDNVVEHLDIAHLADLRAAAQSERNYLWHDLHRELRANPGIWSAEAHHIAYRIAALTRHLGEPAPWQQVPYSLLANDLYVALHARLGMPVELDMEQVEALEARRRERTRALAERLRIREDG